MYVMGISTMCSWESPPCVYGNLHHVCYGNLHHVFMGISTMCLWESPPCVYGNLHHVFMGISTMCFRCHGNARSGMSVGLFTGCPSQKTSSLFLIDLSGEETAIGASVTIED